ncbi:unnamed protein product [Callosobruchus maculatus]|uniref:Uncharacterized protein n=1 Tax=Callosobruchus maculatus TaxID=64391 RepID=A0A653DF14_CALMS|nr:unnamed protein product [Callosobruchus maculatus]
MKSFILSILALFVIVAVCEAVSAKCGPNEAVPNCEPCPEKCEDRDNICLQVCIPTTECHCKPGYLKKNGVCVPRSEC